MKTLLFLLLLPSLSYASCSIRLNDIQTTVKNYLLPLHKEDNGAITEEMFRKAYRKVDTIIARVDDCEKYHRAYEYDNYDYNRWGEKSERYREYSRALWSVGIQLKAGYESYELGLLRFFAFDTDMWEKVANEFYQKQI